MKTVMPMTTILRVMNSSWFLSMLLVLVTIVPCVRDITRGEFHNAFINQHQGMKSKTALVL